METNIINRKREDIFSRGYEYLWFVIGPSNPSYPTMFVMVVVRLKSKVCHLKFTLIEIVVAKAKWNANVLFRVVVRCVEGKKKNTATHYTSL